MLIRAFIPAHITAFFVPVFHEEPLKAGSLGAGVNLSKGTNVFASIETGTLERHIHVAFNGEPVKREEAEITYYVAEKLVPKDFLGEVEVWQYFDFPNGYGFGNSAGGALGTALALSYAFGGTWLRAAQLAHEAEVKHKGGLGDVIGQLAGGIEVRIKPGGPGIGVTDNLFFEDYKVLVVPLGRLSTREVLDGDVVKAIEVEGRKALEELLKEPKPERMMVLARNFAEKTGLLPGELSEIARELDKVLKNPSSMIMLGKGLFALVRDEEAEKAKQLLSDMNLPYDIAEIYTERPKVGRWVG
ncbi:GHMP kinase [Thermococcus kodakarensis KOD1]|uniref:Pantoate kinase n=1 Tax=Thermococcus kodakarensis (strain ATCC BAA-918 / JCM 12380 / KOD1) TaxID=69014 RepID=POK_THEKO|nr:pantoate kinase [Thermococcus kodakarensis]Q5JHF1.1 RecName: Full=Pantoate kinase; Short=PoK [Thermococcus kodakarensis KOD1]6JBC_A Chain A, Pantoate kinase [Thermococcus kodakarensis KOD1]6JBD_A Chain A, Pantoate kinase [Thermococcus kodakarensis KOD1]WCN27986.1 pantoate kinase [Thermococcus kodakarensis]WCN30285.1 pantoate kinase [Thermococcus kodakarensis]BAD86330.1 GHMP kinase [Thermococcus kodakarensis KOD1]